MAGRRNIVSFNLAEKDIGGNRWQQFMYINISYYNMIQNCVVPKRKMFSRKSLGTNELYTICI